MIASHNVELDDGVRFRRGVDQAAVTNALDVADEVNDTIADLKTRFPTGLKHLLPYDTTRFVKVSIREVLKTLGEAMLLVFLVVLLQIKRLR